MQPAIGTDERILRQITRIFMTAGKAITQSLDLPLMAFDDHF